MSITLDREEVQRLHFCCPDAGCDAHNTAIQFLKSWGVAFTEDVDDDGHHYAEYRIPAEWTDEKFNLFLSDLAKRAEARAIVPPHVERTRFRTLVRDLCDLPDDKLQELLARKKTDDRLRPIIRELLKGIEQ